MNWLERARCEIHKTAVGPTANSAEGNPTAVMAVPPPVVCEKTRASLDAESAADFRDGWTLLELLADWDERAGIMEDSGVSRADAEREAWLRVICKLERVN